jgi:hypothetical protein
MYTSACYNFDKDSQCIYDQYNNTYTKKITKNLLNQTQILINNIN